MPRRAFLHHLAVSTASLVCMASTLSAAPFITPLSDASAWTVPNRHATHAAKSIHLDATSADGVLWLNDVTFADGTIELDLKGPAAAPRSPLHLTSYFILLT